jgi:aldose 1-epimerase
MSPAAVIEPTGLIHEGHAIRVATITSPSGIQMRVLSLGGIVWSLEVPDHTGALADVVLGFDDPADYLRDVHYVGGIVGRYANRIRNACFTLDGQRVQLTANHGPHHLHGGARGFHRVPWQMEAIEQPGVCGVTLTYTSPDGEEGYPGTLAVRVTYIITDQGTWTVTYHAQSDRPTPVSLTQHSYFNLRGWGTVRDHELQIVAEHYLPVDADQLPAGMPALVAGTGYDLRAPRRVGEVLDDVGPASRGLDHTYVVEQSPAAAATLHDPASGRTVTVSTTAPGLHCYTGNFLDDVVGKQGVIHQPHDALCLETQHFPDAPNRPDFPGSIVRPGMPFTSRTTFAFTSTRPAPR